MVEVWINAFQIVARSTWTPELKQSIGESVLNKLFEKWQENQDIPIPDDIHEFMKSKNHQALTTIEVSTS